MFEMMPITINLVTALEKDNQTQHLLTGSTVINCMNLMRILEHINNRRKYSP